LIDALELRAGGEQPRALLLRRKPRLMLEQQRDQARDVRRRVARTRTNISEAAANGCAE
jgi:hypothetical protein